MAQDRKQALVARIQALLAKTVDNGATAEEAAAAAAKAQELLLKYNIDEAELGERSEREELVLEFYNITNKRGDLKEWRRNLMWTVARTTMCKAYQYGNETMQILGKPTNVQIAIALYESLFNQLNALLERDVTIAKETGIYGNYNGNGSRKWRANYLLAAVQIIGQRLASEWEATQRQAIVNNSNALLVIDDNKEAIMAYEREKLKVTTKRAKTANPFTVASALGAEAGRQVEFKRALGE